MQTITEITNESGLGEFETGVVATAAALAANNSRAKWKSVYCTESNVNTWNATQAEQARENAVVSADVTTPDGSYICLDIGVNWFAFGIGCPLASAIMEYFVIAE